MSVSVPSNLPAIELLKRENIHLVERSSLECLNRKSVQLLILNLMPIKEEAELDFSRMLSYSGLDIDLHFLRINSHSSKNTSEQHLKLFYNKFEDIKHLHFDGMIITGAPVELIDFEEVTYWKELQTIFNWTKVNIRSTLYICWATQAALYHFYGVNKETLGAKMFGVFEHTVNDTTHPLFRGFDDHFYIPHSRHTTITKNEIQKKKALTILAESDASGVSILTSGKGREFYFTGHSEYSPMTLDSEYRRDINKGLAINIPVNYYKDNNPNNKPIVSWRAHGSLLFSNWLHYYVNEGAVVQQNNTLI